MPSLAILLAVAGGVLKAHAQNTVELRDITVLPSGRSATITFLLDGPAGTVVIEKKGTNVAQVRMKSIRASQTALASATIRPGVRSVQAHIERRDVLVANITFTHRVVSMAVTRRNANQVTVAVKLSGSAPATKPQRRNWALGTIVIDAGHGGKDPGAIGIGGVQEKDVALAVAKYLEREIKRGMPGVKVVMTRRRDNFVELYRRGKIANEHRGKLFISIHCNSMPEKPHPATGFECYILRPERSDDQAGVAAKENRSIHLEADATRYDRSRSPSHLLFSLTASVFTSDSRAAAKAILRGMGARTELQDRGIHEAGFIVLAGALMPAVLVEIGYLSNERDVKLLKSDRGQRSIARGLYDGIRAFENDYAD